MCFTMKKLDLTVITTSNERTVIHFNMLHEDMNSTFVKKRRVIAGFNFAGNKF